MHWKNQSKEQNREPTFARQIIAPRHLRPDNYAHDNCAYSELRADYCAPILARKLTILGPWDVQNILVLCDTHISNVLKGSREL